jgi:Domain of unknown function (DU1801)
MAAENKTKPTCVSVDDFIAAVPNPVRREDAMKVRAQMERLSGEPATMWGPTIVGFGTCHYKYESGREGDMPRIGFSPRGSELVLYLSGDYTRHQPLMDRLGKHRTGKSCLYIKKLGDVDEEVLEALMVETLAHTDEKYPR